MASADNDIWFGLGVFLGVLFLILILVFCRTIAIWLLWNFVVTDLLTSAEPCSIWQAILTSILLQFIIPTSAKAEECTD